jgi:hypothetical protein
MQNSFEVFDQICKSGLNAGPAEVETRLCLVFLETATFQEKAKTYCRVIEDLTTWISSRSITELAEAYFLKGFLFQRAAFLNCNDTEAIPWLTEALYGYQAYLSARLIRPTLAFYAQWQAGILMEALGQTWTDVQSNLMSATRYRRDRAEGCMHVVKHYRSAGENGFAYMFTTIAKEMFHGIELEDLSWSADPYLNRWKIMNYHMSTCNRLGMKDEAALAHEELWKCYTKHPEYFTEAQQQQLFKNKEVFSHE